MARDKGENGFVECVVAVPSNHVISAGDIGQFCMRDELKEVVDALLGQDIR